MLLLTKENTKNNCEVVLDRFSIKAVVTYLIEYNFKWILASAASGGSISLALFFFRFY